MPTHDYKCAHCPLAFEQRTPIDKADVVTCPTCGQFAERQPGAPSFTVKGFNAANGYGK